MDLSDFCRKLPKAELHAHLNGSLGPETLINLGVDKDLIETYSIKNMKKDGDALKHCFELFKIAHNATKTVENVYLATQNVIEDFYADNVIYLELRTTPRSEIDMSKKQYIQSVINAINDNKKPIVVKLILCLDRRHDFSDSETSLDLILEMKQIHPDVIVGLDLCGDPYVGNFYKDLFVKARIAGLKITLHCAEVNNQQEILEMIKFRPDRIGHGTFLNPKFGGSKETWDLYSGQNIILEVCLTSNILCRTAPDFENHHIREWFASGLNFCICTDDSGVFDTTLSKELYYCSLHYNLTKMQLFEINFNAIKNSFASDKEKSDLFNRLDEWKKCNF